jgi:hypothetical protein
LGVLVRTRSRWVQRVAMSVLLCVRSLAGDHRDTLRRLGRGRPQPSRERWDMPRIGRAFKGHLHRWIAACRECHLTQHTDVRIRLVDEPESGVASAAETRDTRVTVSWFPPGICCEWLLCTRGVSRARAGPVVGRPAAILTGQWPNGVAANPTRMSGSRKFLRAVRRTGIGR